MGKKLSLEQTGELIACTLQVILQNYVLTVCVKEPFALFHFFSNLFWETDLLDHLSEEQNTFNIFQKHTSSSTPSDESTLRRIKSI